MKPLLFTLFSALVSFPAAAHPGSGIIVDSQGNVFVADINRGLLKFTPNGKVIVVMKEAGHWLTVDPEGEFAQMDFQKSTHWPRWFKHRNPPGGPGLISDGGSPLVVHRNGKLYFVCNDADMTPGGLQIGSLSSDGKLALVAPGMKTQVDELGGIKGLATGPDGSLYAATPGAVLKVNLDGTFMTLKQPIVTTDCERDLPANTPRAQEPFLTGIAVNSRGEIFLAATGCRSVLKLDSAGRVSTVLRATAPWSPTGLFLEGEDLYVAEWTNAHSDQHNYRPRVRKVARDGKITTVGTVPE